MTSLQRFWLVFLIFLFVCLFFVELYRRKKKLFRGKIVYDDLAADSKAKVFFSQQYGLAGKPDALIKEDGMLIPVEIKGMAAPETPYHGHVMQLTAYCLLIEEANKIPPAYGILSYRDKEFKIPYTINRKESLLRLMDTIRMDDAEDFIPPVSKTSRKCTHCGYNSYCLEQKSNCFTGNNGTFGL